MQTDNIVNKLRQTYNTGDNNKALGIDEAMTTNSDLSSFRIDIQSDPLFAAKFSLFRDNATPNISKILTQCPHQELRQGEVLLEPGQANHHIYFLLRGRLDIRLKSVDSPVADTIEPGDCIGEMSIIDGEPTSAFVVAQSESTVLMVHESVFWSKIATEANAVRNLSRVLAERMRKRNEATLRALEKEMRLEQLQRELAAAYEIQNGMLPPGPWLLRGTENVDVYARMSVVKSVGGDFYDAFRVNKDQICIAIGDVSGKGMPAALFMVRTLTLLRTELSCAGELDQLMGRFNKALCDTNIAHMFTSLIVLRLCTSTGEVEYVNAGHSPFIISKSSENFSEESDCRGLIAGVLRENTYQVGKLILAKGDRLVMYTDGVTEARNDSQKFFGARRLIESLNEKQSANAEELVKTVFRAIDEFRGARDVTDDITVVAVDFATDRKTSNAA
ncbi:MAG: SpoIIE family protein phosphatase [Gammaproteobacteria bacterium]